MKPSSPLARSVPVRGNTIEIQGDHRDELVAELIALGYAAKRSGG